MAASSSTIRILTEQTFAFAPRRLHDPSIGDELRHNCLQNYRNSSPESA
jgi:hypothetical protein